MRHRRTAVPRIHPLHLVLGLAVLLAAPQALAGSGILEGSGDFVPPNASGTGLEDFTSDRIGFSFWVDQRGVYTIYSQIKQTPFPGRVLLHRGPIDPDHPLNRLIAVADYDEEGNGVSFPVLLEAGVIYYVSTTYARDEATTIVDFAYGAMSGPGEVRLSFCRPPGDDIETVDLGEALDLNDHFCVEVEWRDHQGHTGRGTTVPYRSADSGLFWFFNPDNWEVQVKVLDGCAVNGHYWVFLAATTNVEFDLFVCPERGDRETCRVYHNPLGQRADTVTDTAAFPCDG